MEFLKTFFRRKAPKTREVSPAEPSREKIPDALVEDATVQTMTAVYGERLLEALDHSDKTRNHIHRDVEKKFKEPPFSLLAHDPVALKLFLSYEDCWTTTKQQSSRETAHYEQRNLDIAKTFATLLTSGNSDDRNIAHHLAEFLRAGLPSQSIPIIIDAERGLSGDAERQILFECRRGFRTWHYGPYTTNEPQPTLLAHFLRLIREGSEGQAIARCLAPCDTYYGYTPKQFDTIEFVFRHLPKPAIRNLLIENIAWIDYGVSRSSRSFFHDIPSVFQLDAQEAHFLEMLKEDSFSDTYRRLQLAYMLGNPTTRAAFTSTIHQLSLSDISALASQINFPYEEHIPVDQLLDFIQRHIHKLRNTSLQDKFSAMWGNVYEYGNRVDPSRLIAPLAPTQRECVWNLSQGRCSHTTLGHLTTLVSRDTPDQQFTNHYRGYIIANLADEKKIAALAKLTPEHLLFFLAFLPEGDEIISAEGSIPTSYLARQVVTLFPEFFSGKSINEVIQLASSLPGLSNLEQEDIVRYLGILRESSTFPRGDFGEFREALMVATRYSKESFAAVYPTLHRFSRHPNLDKGFLETASKAASGIESALRESYGPRLRAFLEKTDDLPSVELVLNEIPYGTGFHSDRLHCLFSSVSGGLADGDRAKIEALFFELRKRKEREPYGNSSMKDVLKTGTYTLDQLILLARSEHSFTLSRYYSCYGQNIEKMQEFSNYFSSLPHQDRNFVTNMCIPGVTYTLDQIKLYVALYQPNEYYIDLSFYESAAQLTANVHRSGEQSLQDIQKTYNEICDLLRPYEGKSFSLQSLVKYRDAYLGNIENLRFLCTHLPTIQDNDSRLKIIAQYKDLIQNDSAMLPKILDALTSEESDTIRNFKNGQIAEHALDIIDHNLPILTYLQDLLSQLIRDFGADNIYDTQYAFAILLPFIQAKKENLEAAQSDVALLLPHLATLSSTQIFRLKLHVNTYKTHTPLCIYAIELMKDNREDTLQTLATHIDMYSPDADRMRIAAAYFDDASIYDEGAWKEFEGIYTEHGAHSARDYLMNLQQEAQGILGPDIPEELRKKPGYLYMVHHIFPKGNYSSHEKNLEHCGDQLGHVASYQFLRNGYPTTMTGLLGYRLLDDKEENQVLLGEYQRRLGKVRNFVSSRGPDNEALQEALEKKILAKINALPARWDAVKNLEGLTVKEMLLMLFLEEAVKRHHQKNSKPDPEVLDLLVEYKYAYNEELEAYIQRTADETNRFKDPVSQRFNLWKELSVIYGENMKHVLRHEIFESFAEDSIYRRAIESAFSDAVSDTKNAFSISEKQRERIIATFSNPHIPNDKKLDTLFKQAVHIYGNNLKFSSDAAKRQFEDDIRQALSVFQDSEDFSAPYFFEHVAPRIEAIRLQYALNLSGVLEDIFATDINLINQEVAKYEEVIETEMKETSMGGNRHKGVEKKAKKRNIRGYITKTKETSNARMGAYLCIANDHTMWTNPNYLELVLKDEDTGKCVGVVMLLNIQASDGKKYLWFGPNPFESFLGQVSSEQCYNYMYQTVTRFAEENNFDGVVVPAQEGKILGGCTNRGGDFPDLIKRSRLRDTKDQVKVVPFGASHKLGGSYSYSDGALIWERKPRA